MTTAADSLTIPAIAPAAPVEPALPSTQVQSHAVATALRSQRFGVELECVGRNRMTIAKAIARALKVPATAIVKGTDYYKSYFVCGADGRKWRVMGDSSLTGTGRHAIGWSDLSGEVVTPVLTDEDRPLLREVVRAVKRCGATVDTSCGMHVHVGAEGLTVAAIARLCTDVENYERFFDLTLCRAPSRRERFAKPLPAELNAALRTLAGKVGSEPAAASLALQNAWYTHLADNDRDRDARYHASRYHGLNLHALFTKGTVEARWFDGTLDDDEVLSNVDVALAIVARARVATNIKPGAGFANVEAWVRYPVNADVLGARHFYEKHGLVGAEYAETRARLTARVRAAQPTAAAG